jgi:hypothetical protein
MENDAIADEILSVLQALLEAAGPEWTLEALGALLQEVGGGGEMPPEAMPEPAMPMRSASAGPKNAFANS